MKKIFYILTIGILLFSSCKNDDTVYNTAAKATFEYAENTYMIGDAIQFTDKSVPSEGNTIVAWDWKFGDSDESKSIEQNPSHTYSASGTFTITLTVTDNNGLKAQASKDITILDPDKLINITWQSPLLGAIESTVSPALSADGKTVYAIADQSADNAYDVQLKAYDATSGSVKWSFNVNDALAARNSGGGVRLIYASPTVGANGDIYVVARDLKNSGTARKSFLFAISSDGSLHWAYAFGIDANLNYVTPAVDANGYIYIGHTTNSPYAVTVLNPSDGSLVKQISVPVGITSGLSVSKNGEVYFCSSSAGLYSYDIESASQKFNYNPYSGVNCNIALDSDGTIYTVGKTSAGGAVCATNPDGSEKWKFELPSPVNYGGVIIGEDGTIYATGGSVIADQETGGIVALDKDGNLKWHFATAENVTNCVPMVDNRGYIHFVTDDAVYYIVKPDGTAYASLKIGEKSNSSPVMNADGNVLLSVETEAGVSAVLNLSTGASSPANSAWPMKSQNWQRTGLQK